MPEKHKVVIIGGGFGGLYAAKSFKNARVDVTVIDCRNYHLFQPLLYQVATGSLSAGEIAAPLRGILAARKNIRVILGEAVDIDPEGKHVVLRDGSTVSYDSLIVATGSESSYFGHDEWRQFAPPLKGVEDALAIRRNVLFAFEMAERSSDPAERDAWLTFVIVGGGATGVELAGAFGEIAHKTLREDFRSFDPASAKILVVEGGPRILASFPDKLSARAEHSLKKLGATVRTGTMVSGVDERGVTVKSKSGEERIPARTVIWAAGVAVSAFGKTVAKRTGAPTQKPGRIEVTSYLTIPEHPEIFVVGDLAWSTDSKGKPLPGVAQVAMQGGAFAAKVIKRRLRGQGDGEAFEYFDKGELAVIGRASAVARVFGVNLSGLIAWLVWLFIHLMYIVEFQSRILVFVQWGFLYLTSNRGAMLITGQSHQSGAPQANAAQAAKRS